MRASRTALLVAMFVALGAALSAHRRDEYLQAARIAVEPDRVRLELSLTPGIAVADTIIRDIDQDDDGALSPNEQQAYAARILSALTLRIDNSPTRLHLEALASRFPDFNAMRNGDGTITMRSEAAVPILSVGPHHLSFQNGNAAPENVYLANALVPVDDHVAVTGQQRDGDQRELTIDFVVRRTALPFSRWWVWMSLAGGLVLATPLIWRARPRRA